MVAILENRSPQTSFGSPGFMPNMFWAKTDQLPAQPALNTSFTTTYMPLTVEGVPIRDNDIDFQVEEAFFKGTFYINAGKFAEAVNVFQQIVLEFPYSYAAHFNLGFSYGRLITQGMASEQARELIERSLEHFTQAATLKPTDADSHYCKALPHMLLGKFNEAEADLKLTLKYESTLSDYPRKELPWLHYVLGWQYIYGALKNNQEESIVYLQKAESLLSKAIELKSKDSWPLYSLGVVYYELGRRKQTEQDIFFEKAINAYKESLIYDNSNSQVYNDLGVVYQSLENYLAAIEAYRKSVEINLTNIPALHNLGNSLMFLERYTEALGVFSQTLNLDSEDVVALNGLGAAYIAVGMYDEATTVLRHALNNDARSVLARINLGVLNYRLGQLEAAERLFLEAREADPSNKEAEHNLSVIKEALAHEDQNVSAVNRDSYDELRRFFDISPSAFIELLERANETADGDKLTTSREVYENLQQIKQSLEALFSTEEIWRWLRTPKDFLNGRTPVDMIIEGQSYRVLDALVRLEEGIPN
jgi:tetratricopeptide (TPR) repeat protein